MNLKCSLYGTDVPQKTPDQIFRELGITYAHATPQSLFDCWWFWNCENIPENLPDYITELKLTPMDAVGHGLTKERAEQLISDGLKLSNVQAEPWRGMARMMLLGASGVTVLGIGSSALFGSVVLNSATPVVEPNIFKDFFLPLFGFILLGAGIHMIVYGPEGFLLFWKRELSFLKSNTNHCSQRNVQEQKELDKCPPFAKSSQEYNKSKTPNSPTIH